MSKMYLRDLILSKPILKKAYSKFRSKSSNDLMNEVQLEEYLNKADKIFLDKTLPKDFHVGIVNIDNSYLDLGLVRQRDYYPKYERFLKNNNINYDYYNPLLSNWIEEAKTFDLIIWHTGSSPSTQDIAEGKIYLLEKIGVKCFPSFDEVWSYENKIRANYLYELYGLPSIPTFISHSKQEALEYLNKARLPIISKISTGSSSYGVDKIDSIEEGKKLIEQTFSYKGKETYFKYLSQKDYVYFQEFIDDATYDLRVICIGDQLLGYYRYPNKGDFKASGAGNYEKKAIPTTALDLAYEVRKSFGATCLVTDFVYSEKRNQFLIIESSIFIGVDTCEQLSINGTPGKYVRQGSGNYEFVPGRFWIQELALKYFIEKNL